MNKFLVFPCSVKDNKDGYNGQVVTLVCASSTGFAIFFPVSEENAKIINTVLELSTEKLDANVGNILGVYKTMVDSWNSGGKFLSGIYMDTEFDPSDKTEIISVKALISTTRGGYLDNVVKMNFIHAIIIAAMYRFEIVVSKDLVNKLIPPSNNEKNSEEDEEDEDTATLSKKHKKEAKEDRLDPKKFPKDTQILKIAKKIMNGKIK